jgi:hypothetical protein
MQYRRWWYPVRRSLFQNEETFEGLCPDAKSTTEYFEGLIRFRERLVDRLYRRQQMNFSIGNESLLSTHLSAIQSLKNEISQVTGGVDEMKRRQQIVGQVATVCVKTFLPFIAESQRDEVLKIFRGELLRVSEEV